MDNIISDKSFKNLNNIIYFNFNKKNIMQIYI